MRKNQKTVNKGEKLRDGGITCISRLKEKAEELIEKGHVDPVCEFMTFACRTPESGQALSEYFIESTRAEMERRNNAVRQATS